MEGEPEPVVDHGINCNISESLSDHSQAKLETLEKKAVHLRLVLEKDFKAADLKWSLFVAAAFSFRYESCLRPFPSAFMRDGIKDMDELLSVITDVPALDLFLQQLDNLDNLANISDVINLLFFVLVRLNEPTLKTVPPESHESILPSAGKISDALKPQYIFRVCSSSQSAAETKWREISENHSVFYAFHGNRLENFYTILNFGLQQHLYKNTGKGNGVYLSQDLNMVLPQSHGGFGWGASSIGGHLSCVALCEVIDAPDGINYQRPVTSEGDAIYSEDRTDTMYMGDTGHSLTHYVVTNCDLVRVRYLLVYAKQPPSFRFSITPGYSGNGGSFKQWLTKHKLFSVLLGYGFMLATIGFANNQPIHNYYKILLQKLDMASM